MADFYKFEIANWNEGTASLTLEQEAAYLRVVNAIRLSDQALTFTTFALCGLWRCNERKAKRLLQELIDAGKLRVEDGKIINDKAVNDASTLRRLRADRASAGSRGGIESGKSRRKSLENNETAEASASTREEKRREEKKEEANASSKEEISASAKEPRGTRVSTDWTLPEPWFEWAVREGLSAPAARREAERFGDYWRSVAGAKGVKRDWEATWRNWVRKVIEDRPKAQRSKSQPEIGDKRESPDGREWEYSGASNGWVEVFR